MGKECNHHIKVCFQNSEVIYKYFYSLGFLEYFNLMSKKLEAKNSCACVYTCVRVCMCVRVWEGRYI